jgi:hypothetical protein
MTFCFPLVDVPDTKRNMHCPLPLSLCSLSFLALSFLSRVDCGLSGLLSSSSSFARVSRLLSCCNTLQLPPPPPSLVSPLFQILFCCLELADVLQDFFVTIFFSMFFSRLGCASFFFSGGIDTNLYVSTVCAHWLYSFVAAKERESGRWRPY